MKNLILSTLATLATLANAATVRLEWQDNSDNETVFEIQRSADNGQTWTPATVPADVTTYADESIVPGVTYLYRVRAANEYGYSGFTNTVSYTHRTAPNDPSDLLPPSQMPVLRFTTVDGKTAIVEIVQ